MNKRKEVLYWFLYSLCAMTIGGLLYYFAVIPILEKITYRTECGRYMLPFGIVRWWEGMSIGLVFSLFYGLALIRLHRKRDFTGSLLRSESTLRAIIYSIPIYTVVITYFTFIALIITEPVDANTFHLLSPFAVLGHSFASTLFFIAVMTISTGMITNTISCLATKIFSFFQQGE